LSSHLSYVEAVVVGAFQGVTELFPVSSLGHSVLIPALVGGRWAQDLNVSAPESPYLAFIVGLHVATAAALLLFFWRDWLAIVGGFITSVRHRRVSTPAERLAWLMVVATIPVGIAGLALEHVFRTTLGRPVPAAAFLAINGVVLYAGERLRRRTPAVAGAPPVNSGEVGVNGGEVRVAGGEVSAAQVNSGEVSAAQVNSGEVSAAQVNSGLTPSDERIAELTMRQGVLIGSAQILALLPGISRSGITMVAGLWRGLNHEEAARFSFLLATPVILAAGMLKIPDLFGPMGEGIHGQVLAGSVASFVAAYLAVRYLTHYFETRTLTPFAIYCTVVGIGSLIWLLR
jgi:undecaprenyl-diphosphatase